MGQNVSISEGCRRTGQIRFPHNTIVCVRWPDCQLTSLCTRGFKVAGLVEPTAIYPKVDRKGETALHHLLEFDEADTWNLKLEGDTQAFDHDKDVWDTSQDQRKRHLLFGALTKREVEAIFGKGRWRGIHRRGI